MSRNARLRSISSSVPWSFPEARDFQHQLAARFALDGDDAPHQIAPLVPGLQLGARAAHFQHEILRGNREPLLARLAQHGILAGFEKAAYNPQNVRLEDFRTGDFRH